MPLSCALHGAWGKWGKQRFDAARVTNCRLTEAPESSSAETSGLCCPFFIICA